MTRLALLAALAMTMGQDDDLARELPRIKPHSPADALATFRIRPGFHLKTVASEPLVTDPVSACYDADGRLYVVEMRGYPYPENTPTGNVRLLEDSDADGTFDKSTIFVDGLSWPTGVVPYDGGVFVAVAPDILYAKDSNGDGKADIKKVMFTGFGIGNVQALMNGLLWGPDGWIYGVSGGNGGDITCPSHPERKPVSLRGRDFRFKPDGSAFEPVAGGGQFGHAFDDWGHRFTCNNSNHIRQIVATSTHGDSSPMLASPPVILDIAAEGPAAPVYRISAPEPWRVVRTRQRVADPAMLARLPETERFAFGFFTSATGITIYRGSAFPDAYRGNAFIGDVGGNLVHRKTLTVDGVTYLATRAEPDQKVEFLASTDNWFRPVNFANTPSGTLLMLDMYRETIEHPLSIPEPIKKHLDLTSGKDMGRLYEIVPEGFHRRHHPRLSGAKTPERVALLADPDAWWRETAQRLLIESRDPSAIPLLKALARDRPNALGRVHALWTLDALGALDADDLLPAMTDPEPRVREQAAHLAYGRLDKRQTLSERLLALADDPDPMVRFQTAIALAGLRDGKAIPKLAAIAVRDRSSPYVRQAVIGSSRGRLTALSESLSKVRGFVASPEGRRWVEDIAGLAAAGKDAGERDAMIASLTSPDVEPGAKRAAAIGLDRGLRQTGRSLRGVLSATTADRLAPMFASAREDAESETRDVSRRVDAIRVVGLGPIDGAIDALPALLDARQPGEIQLAALQAIGGLPDRRVGPLVVSRWKALSPSVRREAAEVLFANAERLGALLDAVESGDLKPGELDPARRKQLLSHADAKVRDRGAKLLGGEAKVDRRRVIESLKPALSLAGDRERGRAVFQKTCSTCHKAEAGGEAVGPDLATVTGRTPEDLLVHILDPNREVLPQYLDYAVATKDGRLVSGMIAQETAGAVTLKRAGGVAESIPRSQIDAISSTGASLMPEGLEAGLTAGDLADLIAFVRGLQAAPARR